MKTKYYLSITVLVIALLFGISPTAAAKGKPGGGGGKPPPDPPPPSDPAIVYVAEYNFSRQDLMLMDEDGANQTVLLQGAKSLARTVPSWSPDGTRIAFISSGPESGLYTIDVASRNVNWLAAFPAGWTRNRIAHSPSWAPLPILNEEWIAYTRTSVNNADDLFLFSVSTGYEIQLTDTPDLRELSPSWSPDATQLVMHVQDLDGADDILVYELQVDVTNSTIGVLPVANLTPDEAPFGNVRVKEPAWAKTSDRIAFAVDTPEGPDNIWTVEWVGESLTYTQITDDPDIHQHGPTWSSDDAFIAFAGSGRQDGDAIYRIDAGGLGDPQLLALPSGKIFDLWLPEWRR